MNDNPIKMYFHCGNCTRNGKPDKIAVGVSDHSNVTVWCESCDSHVGTFKLAEPLHVPGCECCGGGVKPH